MLTPCSKLPLACFLSPRIVRCISLHQRRVTVHVLQHLYQLAMIERSVVGSGCILRLIFSFSPIYTSRRTSHGLSWSTFSGPGVRLAITTRKQHRVVVVVTWQTIIVGVNRTTVAAVAGKFRALAGLRPFTAILCSSCSLFAVQ